MAGLGTGQPLSFMCSVERRDKWRWRGVPHVLAARHQPIYRTGRTRSITPGRGRRGESLRTLAAVHEYRCACGHVGWSRHRDVLRCAVAP